MRNTSPDRAPRTSHKLVGPWDSPGPPIGATHPQPAMAAGVARATGGSSAVRTPARYPAQAPGTRTRRVAMPIGKVRPGHREAAQEGAANEPWKEQFFSRAACSPPPADATTRLHDRRTGPDRRARPAAASGRRRRLDRERGGPGRGRAGAARPAWRLSTIHAAKGGTGRPPGGCKRALERTFFSRAACSPPRAVQGSKPFSNGLAPRSPATRARISSKAADPSESQGKAADWRCIHAHFPVKNQVIP